MKCRTVIELDCMCETCRSGGECTAYPDRKVPAGTIIEHPNAFRLVRMTGYYPDGTHVPGPNATHSEGGLVFDEFDE